MDDEAWSPVLDPQWRRDFGLLERRLDEIAELEHVCDCDVCHRLAERRAWDVVTSWAFTPADEQRRWLDVYEWDTRGAILRDAMAAIGSERIMGLMANIEQLRALGMIR